MPTKDAAPVIHPHPQAPAQSLVEKIRKANPSIPFEAGETLTDVDLRIAAEHFLKLVRELRERRELAFDFLRNVSGVDFEAEGMALVYQLYSFKHRWGIQLTVATSAGHPHV